MHPHTKLVIPTSKKCRRYAPDMIILETRSEVKVALTRKWHTTLSHPKMQSHTKFVIPTMFLWVLKNEICPKDATYTDFILTTYKSNITISKTISSFFINKIILLSENHTDFKQICIGVAPITQ